MKSYIKYIVAFFLSACSQIHFDTDLPRKAIVAKSFDLKIYGQYGLADSIVKLKDDIYYNLNYFEDYFKIKDSCMLISAVMTVSEKLLFYDFRIRSYYKSMDGLDTIDIIKRHSKEKRISDANYLIFEGKSSDTLLDLRRNDKIRVYKGKYYLNHFIDEHDWEIFQLIVLKDNLISFNLTSKKDKELLKASLIKRHQIFGDIVSVSDEGFKNFIERGGFRSRFKFKNITGQK